MNHALEMKNWMIKCKHFLFLCICHKFMSTSCCVCECSFFSVSDLTVAIKLITANCQCHFFSHNTQSLPPVGVSILLQQRKNVQPCWLLWSRFVGGCSKDINPFFNWHLLAVDADNILWADVKLWLNSMRYGKSFRYYYIWSWTEHKRQITRNPSVLIERNQQKT